MVAHSMQHCFSLLDLVDISFPLLAVVGMNVVQVSHDVSNSYAELHGALSPIVVGSVRSVCPSKRGGVPGLRCV